MDRDLELTLVAGLRTGEAEAFDAVHQALNGRLFNFLARLSGRRDIAEDLLEEMWLRLVVYAPRLKPDTRLAPWLFTVARNLYASHCRSRLVEQVHAGGLMGLWPGGYAQPTPLESAVAGETERRVAAALVAMPIPYREALLLVAVEGLQPSEAAAICGVSAVAMRQRLSRARALLARHLAESESISLRTLNVVPT